MVHVTDVVARSGPLAVLLLLALGPSAAHGEPLTLRDTLAQASEGNVELRRMRTSKEQATLAHRATRGRSAPVLGLTANSSTTETQSFLGGQPLQTSTDVSDVGLSVGGRSATGSTWSVAASHSVVDQLVSVDLASLLPIPGATDGPVELRYWTTNVGASVRQDLLAPFRRTPERRELLSAREREAQAAQALETAETSTLVAVAVAWWQWWTATERVALGEDALARVERIDARLRVSAEAGTSTNLDLLRSEQAVLEAQARLARARADAASLEDDVLLWMGRPPSDDIAPVPSDAVAWEAPDLETVLRDNPDARRAQLEVDISERLLRDARSDGLPALEGVLGVGYASLEDRSGAAWNTLVTDPLPTYSAGVEMNVPLGRASVRARRDSAELELQAATAARQAIRHDLERSYAASIANRATAARQAAVAEQAVEVARLALRIEQSRVDQGASLVDDLLDAEEAVREAELALLDARVGVQRAELALAALSGPAGLRPTPQDG